MDYTSGPRDMECESFERQLGMNDLMSAYGMMHRLIQHHATSCHPMLGWLTRRERFQSACGETPVSILGLMVSCGYDRSLLNC